MKNKEKYKYGLLILATIILLALVDVTGFYKMSINGDYNPIKLQGCLENEIFYNNTCMPLSDYQLARPVSRAPDNVVCTSAGGIWSNNACQCPVDSIGWKDNFGCDYSQMTEPKDTPQPFNVNVPSWVYVALAGMGIVTVLALMLKKKRR